jgi:hypothetical protein
VVRCGDNRYHDIGSEGTEAPGVTPFNSFSERYLNDRYTAPQKTDAPCNVIA